MRKFFGRPRFKYGIGRSRDILWELEQMKKEMERMFREEFEERLAPKELIKEYETPEGAKVREIGPIVYGYSVTIGPDGRPRVREFGNVKRLGISGPRLSAEREPMADVIVSDKDIKVVVELPGVEKEQIKVNAREGAVEIAAETADRKYRREVEIPPETDIRTASSTYRNGILEINFKKKAGSESREIKID
jgi:HSP20 family protein